MFVMDPNLAMFNGCCGGITQALQASARECRLFL